MQISFTKMHAVGNDYIYLNNPPYRLAGEQVQKLCDRHTGVGSDGVIVLSQSSDPEADVGMTMFNSDGSPSAMCGNGIRCVAWLAKQWGYVLENQVTIQSQNLRVNSIINEDKQWHGNVTADLPGPQFGSRALKLNQGESDNKLSVDLPTPFGNFTLFLVNMGNPHGVICFDEADEISDSLVMNLGQFFNRHSMFREGVNLEFIVQSDTNRVYQRTYERGTGETLACGSGAAAVVATLTRQGKVLENATVEVEMKGGVVSVLWDQDKNVIQQTSDVYKVFDGILETRYLFG